MGVPMRGYLTTTVATVDAIFRDGFVDLYEFGGVRGVWLADHQLGINDGFEGPVTICLEVPNAVFERHEWVEEHPASYRLSLIPAAILNGLGKPQVYDHLFAGAFRVQVIRAIRRREQAGITGGSPSLQDLRDAIAFLDRIGWLTPVKVQEEAASDGPDAS
jgi:hypothetical protein